MITFGFETKTKIIIVLVISLAGFLNLFLQTPSLAIATPPELPRTYINTTFPTQSASSVTRNVKLSCTAQESHCYTSLQTAIDQAVLGDSIVISAGMVISGPIILRNKSSGSGYLIIRSSNLSNLPVGNRVKPVDAANMAKITAPGSNEPAMETEPSAHNYWIAGLEFAKAAPTAVTDTLILAGDGSNAQNTAAQVPHDLVFDRIYVHGDSTSDLKRGLGLNSASTAVINSYFSNIHGIGFDSQAIAGWNGPGPFKIYNNYLEAATENFILGGSDPFIPNLVSTDVDFENNYVYKPRTWRVGDPSYGGIHWEIKNLFELKNVQRALVQNNIFDGSWADAQTGYAILFTVRDQDGTCTWCVVSDVTFQNNIVQHAAAGFQMLGHDNDGISQLTARLKISNNLWVDINGPKWGGNGWWSLIVGGTTDPGPADVELSHNTVDQTGNIMEAGDYLNSTFITKPNFVIRDNILNHNAYGVLGDTAGIGNNTLDVYFPGVVFTKNAMIAGPANSYSKYAGNYFPTSWSTVVTGESTGDYRVLATSTYHNAATDGTDIGANINTINTATANVISGIGQGGDPPPLPPPPQPAPPPPPPSGVTADTTKPLVTAFDVQLRTGSGSVTATFTATDSGGSFLAQEELLRANSNATNCVGGNISGCSWSHLYAIAAPSNVNTWTGSFSDNPSVGTYLYGTHAHDGAGNIGFEPAIIPVTITSVTRLLGDINLDHVVNSVDYSILNSHWFTSDPASDLTHDGIVNSMDYSILNSHWLQTW